MTEDGWSTDLPQSPPVGAPVTKAAAPLPPPVLAGSGPATGPKAATPSRRILVVLLGLVSVAGILTAVTSAWARGVMIDPTGWVTQIARPTAENPAVQDAIAAELTQRVLGIGGLHEKLRADLPPVARPLTDRIQQELSTQIGQVFKNEVQTPQFVNFFEGAVREVHGQLVSALEDPSTGSTITLDLQPVIDDALALLAQRLDEHLPVDVGRPVAGLVSGLVPKDLGHIEVDVSKVGPVPRLVLRYSEALMAVGVVAGTGAAVLCIVLARRRWRAAAALGAVTAVLAFLEPFMLSTQFSLAAKRVSSTTAMAITDVMRDEVVATMRRWVWIAAAVAAVVAIVGLVVDLIAARSGRDQAP